MLQTPGGDTRRPRIRRTRPEPLVLRVFQWGPSPVVGLSRSQPGCPGRASACLVHPYPTRDRARAPPHVAPLRQANTGVELQASPATLRLQPWLVSSNPLFDDVLLQALFCIRIAGSPLWEPAVHAELDDRPERIDTCGASTPNLRFPE